MKQSTLHELLWQVGSEDIGRIFREQMTLLTRELILEVMAGEVTALCGRAYHPSGGACRRAGSAPGRVVVDGRAEAVVRPRVRRRSEDGVEGEVGLASYRAARDLAAVRDGLLRAFAAGVSSRQAKRVFPCAPGSSSSTVSRLWLVAGKGRLAAFRGRNLSGERWFGGNSPGVVRIGDGPGGSHGKAAWGCRHLPSPEHVAGGVAILATSKIAGVGGVFPRTAGNRPQPGRRAPPPRQTGLGTT